MTRPRRSRLDDPTAENAADTSSPSASGLSESEHGKERNRAEDEDLIRRTSEERDYTPRRYEQPTEKDPVLPSNDASLKTKI